MRKVLVLAASIAVSACSKQEPAPPPATTGVASSSATPAAASDQAAGGSATGASPTPGEVVVGKPPPSFTAKAHDGFAFELSSLKGKPVVLYFYPKDETPGCTKEACSFRDAWKELAKTDVVLVGISTDDQASHAAFAKHHELPFHLVSDPDGSIAKAFGVPNRAGYLARQTFVIGADGNVKKIYRDVDVSKHASEVLADLRS